MCDIILQLFPKELANNTPYLLFDELPFRPSKTSFLKLKKTSVHRSRRGSRPSSGLEVATGGVDVEAIVALGDLCEAASTVSDEDSEGDGSGIRVVNGDGKERGGVAGRETGILRNADNCESETIRGAVCTAAE